MFGCKEVLAHHSEYLDGELTLEEREAVRSHLAVCASCARYDRVVRRGVELLARDTSPELDTDFLQTLHTRLAREDERIAMRPASIAATATLSIAAVLVLVSWMPTFLSNGRSGAPPMLQAGLNASEIAWHTGFAVEPRDAHSAMPAPDVSLTSTNADIELIDRGYSPLILEAPTAPPTYVNASLTTYDTR